MIGTLLLILRLVMALALYAFLAWAVYTLWWDMKRQTKLIDARSVPEITLSVDLEEQERSYEFSVSELVIGRDQTCDLILDANTVSAEHARLSYHHRNWWVEDLRSRNGTLLNLELVSTPAILVSGDELQLGQVLLKVTINNKSKELSDSSAF
jgi:pSer/pThr/pTyr-binding forkhead associated (FHA) protein